MFLSGIGNGSLSYHLTYCLRRWRRWWWWGGGGTTTATLVSIAVTPANPSKAVGTTQQFTATGTYSDSSTQNITASVTWSPSSTGVATVNSSGLATAIAAGSTTITATSGIIFGNTTLTVTSVVLPKTGQTTCYNAAGAVIACATTGQDGELQKGVAWPSPRFTVDGTGLCVTDNLTGLMWVKIPDATPRTWANALTYANDLSICGYTDWRLPNVNDLESLINAGQANTATWLNTQGFGSVQAGSYWSSTTYAYNTTVGWGVYMWSGSVGVDFKTSTFYVWPVRAGQ